MKIEHLGIEVCDLYKMELFYRKALGFRPRYHYVSRNSRGLRTVFLERDGIALELCERPRDELFASTRASAPNHICFAVDDVQSAYEHVKGLAFPSVIVQPPRLTGDGLYEAQLRDPEGNVVELAKRVEPAPDYPIHAVIFDCDGTLVDSEHAYFLADRVLLERYGVTLTSEDKARYVGVGSLEMITDVKRRFSLSPSVSELLLEKNEVFLDIAPKHVTAYREMGLVVSTLRQWGVPMAVASGSSPAVLDHLLGLFDLSQSFDVVVSSEAVGSGKPSPLVFLEAARRLKVPAHECLVFEDSHHGVEAARRALMRCVAIPYLTAKPLSDAFAMADLVFENGMSDVRAERVLTWLKPLLAKDAARS